VGADCPGRRQLDRAELRPHPYIPLDPPPRLLVACVYGVAPITAPFAWHLFLLRLAHRRQGDRQDPDASGQHAQDPHQVPSVPADRQDQPATVAEPRQPS
jgi:hypothetical protein